MVLAIVLRCSVPKRDATVSFARQPGIPIGRILASALFLGLSRQPPGFRDALGADAESDAESDMGGCMGLSCELGRRTLRHIQVLTCSPLSRLLNGILFYLLVSGLLLDYHKA